MKRRMILSLVALVAALLPAGAKELKTATFSVPQMVCEKCEKKVNENLRFEKGVKRIAVDLKKKEVTVTYDPAKTDVEKLRKGFARFKYEARPLEPRK